MQMKQEAEREIPGISGQAEERNLRETLKVVNAIVDNYSRECAKMKADIDEMLEHYHDNDVEVLTILNNTIILHEHMEVSDESTLPPAGVSSQGSVLCCDVSAYGSYLYEEGEVQMDYYFIAGKQQNTILNAYAYLCGKL